MNDEALLAILRLLADGDGISIARAAKKLALSQSQLLRRLTALSSPEHCPGHGWIEVRDGDPPRLFLTNEGRCRLMEQP